MDSNLLFRVPSPNNALAYLNKYIILEILSYACSYPQALRLL